MRKESESSFLYFLIVNEITVAQRNSSFRKINIVLHQWRLYLFYILCVLTWTTQTLAPPSCFPGELDLRSEQSERIGFHRRQTAAITATQYIFGSRCHEIRVFLSAKEKLFIYMYFFVLYVLLFFCILFALVTLWKLFEDEIGPETIGTDFLCWGSTVIGILNFVLEEGIRWWDCVVFFAGTKNLFFVEIYEFCLFFTLSKPFLVLYWLSLLLFDANLSFIVKEFDIVVAVKGKKICLLRYKAAMV